MNIVVIGAGYAGLTAALRLDRGNDITLVSADDHFTERVRLHELAAGRPSVSVPLAELTRGAGITTITALVNGIDLDHRLVRTSEGHELPYDRLVYALGSHTDLSTHGVRDHAYTAETAGKLRARLHGQSGTLAVVGGGLTGIEMAAELAEAYPAWRVTLVSDGEPGAGLSPKARMHIGKVMTRLGVDVRRGEIREVEEGRLLTEGGSIEADVIVWAASFRASPLAGDEGLAVDERGRVLVDDRLRARSHPEVSVVGDAASGLRMSCAVGMPLGAHAADVINGKDGRFRFRYAVQCVSLGRRDGVIQLVRADDSPLSLAVTGRAAAWIKELVVRSTVLALRHPRTMVWLKDK